MLGVTAGARGGAGEGRAVQRARPRRRGELRVGGQLAPDSAMVEPAGKRSGQKRSGGQPPDQRPRGEESAHATDSIRRRRC